MKTCFSFIFDEGRCATIETKIVLDNGNETLDNEMLTRSEFVRYCKAKNLEILIQQMKQMEDQLDDDCVSVEIRCKNE